MVARGRGVGEGWIESLRLEDAKWCVLVSQAALVVKNLPANAGDSGDVGSIPGWGRSSGVGNGNPLKYSCLENSMTQEPGGP